MKIPTKAVVYTPRLSLVLCPPAHSSFWRAYVSVRADPSWQREIWHGTWPAEDPNAAHERNSALVNKRGYGLWAVAQRHGLDISDEEVEWLGWIGYRNLDDVEPQSNKWPPPAGTLEVYIGFARQHWGKGYGPEALKALVEDAFRHRDIKELTACILEDNVASTRCFEKVGFVVAKDDLKYEDEGVYYALNKSQWEQIATT